MIKTLILMVFLCSPVVGDVNIVSDGNLSLMPEKWVYGDDLTLDGEYLVPGDTIAAYWDDLLLHSKPLDYHPHFENILRYMPLCYLCDSCPLPYLCPSKGDTVQFYVKGIKVVSYPVVVFGEDDPIEEGSNYPEMFTRLRSFTT